MLACNVKILYHELRVGFFATYCPHMKKDFVLHLYQQPQTVFTLKDISLLFPELSYGDLKDRASYYARRGKLHKLRRGIYAKEKYNPLEIANKLYTPAYISLETVLQKDGVVFQYYETIFVISYVSRTVQVGDHTFSYRKIKNEILFNRQGIEEKEGIARASKERAFLDAVFLYKNYHFDNLRPLNWERVMELKAIYASKALDKRVAEYYQLAQTPYV